MHISLHQARNLMRITEALSLCRTDNPLDQHGLPEELCALFGVDFIGVAFWDDRAKRFHPSKCIGRDESIDKAYAEQFQFIDPFRAVKRRRPNAGTCLSRMIAPRTLRNSRYYTDHLRNYDLCDGVEASFYHGDLFLGDVRLWRGLSSRVIGSYEERLLDLIVPYFSTIISRRLSMLTTGCAGDVKIEGQTPAAMWVLSPRELEVLRLIARGQTDKEIARHLNMSFWTVRTHITALFRKSKVRNRTELTAIAQAYT